MQTRSGSHVHHQQAHSMQPQTPQAVGNLSNALTNYDVTSGTHVDETVQTKVEEQHPSLLTIQIPTGSQINQSQPNNNEEDRDRSSTLGSEFDLNWAKERGMSLSCLLTPMGELDESNLQGKTKGGAAAAHQSGSHSEGTSVTVSSSSTNNSGVLPMPQCSSVGIALHPLPSLKEYSVKKEEGAASPESASMFLSFNEGNEPWKQQQKQQQKLKSTTLFSHTPPTNIATSYEQRHFQKRMRAGSISGRLRSASDLEDIGIISNDQKGILKDLLIAGNDQVQSAIDKYEAGDSSALEEMIKSGAFSKSIEVDLLGDLDLDLDFLNVHEDDGLVFGMEEDIGGNSAVGGQQRGVARKQVGKVLAPMDETDGPGAHPYPYSRDEGIGELEFNGDAYADPRHDVACHADDTLGLNRIRSNSLALPGLLDGAHHDDFDQVSFGQWMDSDLPHLMNPSPAKQAPTSNFANAHGGHYTLRNPNSTQNADGTSNSFKLQCDLLMQKEGELNYGSSPAVVASMLLDAKARGNKKAESPKIGSPKKTKKKTDTLDVKKKKKSVTPNEVYSTNSIPFIKRDKGGGDDEDVEDKEVRSGLGRPRSMSDPNLTVHLDDLGLLHVKGPEGWVGAYSPDSREIRINRFLEKRNHRVWVKKVKYDVRKNFADSRLRVKGRFVKKEDEMLMRELMSLT